MLNIWAKFRPNDSIKESVKNSVIWMDSYALKNCHITMCLWVRIVKLKE